VTSDADDLGEWEREAAAEAAEQKRIDDADRIEDAHLLQGEWITAAQALARLVRRGSSATSAAFSLINWLQHNDGQRPFLRARAIQIRRVFSRERSPVSTWNDRPVFSFDWLSEIESADWGGGTFVLVEPAEDGRHLEFTTTLTGVRFSLDDLNRLIGPEDQDISAPNPQPFDLSELKQMLKQLHRSTSASTGAVPVTTSSPSPDQTLLPSAIANVGATPRRRLSPREWNAWVDAYRSTNSPLPDVDRVIYPAARQEFQQRVTQAMVREAFKGHRPGPRNLTQSADSGDA
jgi:hypothetical protein